MLASSSRSADLLQEMVRILAGVGTLSDATNDILVAIGTHGGWQFGTLWTLGGDGLLRCEGMWQADAQRPRHWLGPTSRWLRGLAHHLATGETRVLNRRIEITAVRRVAPSSPSSCPSPARISTPRG